MPLSCKAKFFSSSLSTLIFMRIFLSLLRFSKSDCTQKPTTTCGWQLSALCVLIINSVYIRVPFQEDPYISEPEIMRNRFQWYPSASIGQYLRRGQSWWRGVWTEPLQGLRRQLRGRRVVIKTSLTQQARQQLNGHGARCITLLPWWRRNRSRSSRKEGAGGRL